MMSSKRESGLTKSQKKILYSFPKTKTVDGKRFYRYAHDRWHFIRIGYARKHKYGFEFLFMTKWYHHDIPTEIDKMLSEFTSLIKRYDETYQKNMNKKKNTENRWLQGYACAVAALLKMRGMNDSETDELFRSGVSSIKKAMEAGVHENDIEEFRKYYK